MEVILYENGFQFSVFSFRKKRHENAVFVGATRWVALQWDPSFYPIFMFRGDLLIMKLSEEEHKGLGKPPPPAPLNLPGNL